LTFGKLILRQPMYSNKNLSSLFELISQSDGYNLVKFPDYQYISTKEHYWANKVYHLDCPVNDIDSTINEIKLNDAVPKIVIYS
jgi:hypothetical protein